MADFGQVVKDNDCDTQSFNIELNTVPDEFDTDSGHLMSDDEEERADEYPGYDPDADGEFQF